MTIQTPTPHPHPPFLDDHWLKLKMALEIDMKDITKETPERFDGWGVASQREELQRVPRF